MNRTKVQCRHCGRSRFWHRLLFRRGAWPLYCLPPNWDRRSRWAPRPRPHESFTPDIATDVRATITRFAADGGEQIAMEIDL